MRIRLSANLSYSRGPAADPFDDGAKLLRLVVAAVDQVLTEEGYRPNRLRDGEFLDDTLSVEVM